MMKHLIATAAFCATNLALAAEPAAAPAASAPSARKPALVRTLRPRAAPP